ncbi:MAG: mercury transporter [Bdellovibrionaceae bacterium]|jgi:mercuric ion transport protein|nr:mercury transporter [Pseudobdellovibrionaceae bacterium]|tara:strand:- start:308 stop:664 length:357 start_codon:yes stop_codon:yes gene_type:complete
MADGKIPENRSSVLIGGGVFAAFVASLCCIGPLILTLLGVSGAAVLSKLEILRLPMTFIVAVMFGVAGFQLFRKKETCEPDSICANPKKYKRMVRAYWIGLILAVLGITSPNWIVWAF